MQKIENPNLRSCEFDAFIEKKTSQQGVFMCNLVEIMKCQLCEQEATVTYTKIVGDKSQKIHLCALCADDKGVTNIENFSLSDILMDKNEVGAIPVDTKSDLGVCSDCGFSVDDLRKIARLGCSSCYQVFGAEVQSMIGKMHKDVTHKGKVPVGMLKAIELKTKFKDLEMQFKEAVEKEEFERAGELKIELAELKEKLSQEEEVVQR